MDSAVATRPKLFTADLLFLGLASAFSYSSIYLILNYIPQFVISMGGSPADIGLATAAFVFSGLILRPFIGRFIDRFGRKSVLFTGCLVFAITPFLYLLPSDIMGLMVIRAIHGVGLSLFSTAGLTIVVDLSHKSRWGEATGFFLSAQIIAISIAPGIGSLIASNGTLLRLLPYASLLGAFSLLTASRIKVARIDQISRSSSFSHLEIIDKRGILAALVASASVGLGYAMVIAFMPLISIQDGLKDGSLFYFIYALLALIVRTPAGKLSDRVGRRTIIIPMVLLSSLALLIAGLSRSPIALVISALLYGFGFGSAYPVIGALAADSSAVDSRGIVMGLYAGGFDVGLLIGSALGGAVNKLTDTQFMLIAISLFMALGVVVFAFLCPKPSSQEVAKS